MAIMRQIQTNFASGELNPLMRLRSDTGAYQNGAARLRNVALQNTGGVTRRPGTTFLNSLAGQARLLPFDFDENERYICALSYNRLNVYNTSGTLLTGIASSLLCPWVTDELFQISYTQVADTMILCHPNWSPRVISRQSATAFAISEFAFDSAITDQEVYQPYYKFASNTVTLESSANAQDASTTLTASADVFTADHVGTRVRWQGNEIEVTGYTSPTVVTGTIKKALEGSYDPDPFRTTQGSTIIEVTHVGHGFNTLDQVLISGASAVGGIPASSINGLRSIIVLDENTYQINYPYVGTSYPTATSSEDGGGPSAKYTGTNLPTWDWDEQVFSAVRGWPAAVCFHEARLWFGGTTDQPDGMYGSRINQYFNFSVGTGLDNEAIQISIGSEDISKIQHLVSNRDLQIFTATGEFLAPKSTATSLTPSNMRVSRQTPYGSNKVSPVPFDGGTLFIQNSGKAVREYIYADAENSYSSTDLSLLANHLVRNPKDMDVLYGSASRNEQYAFIVNGDDGTIAVFHSARAEQLAGWTLWDFGDATVDAVCCINNTLYASIKRGSYYYLEQFAADDSLTLDFSRNYTSGSPTANWSVAIQYWNQTVAVVSDGYYVGSYTVDGSGNLTLPAAYSSITVGFDYDVEIKTLPVNIALPSGSMVGIPKRINRVIIGLDETLNVSVDGNKLILRKTTDDISVGETPLTGLHEFYLLGYSREPQITLMQSEPVAMRVLGLNMEVAF